MGDAADRTMPPTPRRRELARRQGLMPAAGSPAWVATAATCLLLLPGWAEATLPAATAFMRHSLTAALDRTSAAPGLEACLPVVLPTLAVAAIAAAVGIAVRVVLDGWSWQPSRALPLWGRVSPLAGFARIFSTETCIAVVGRAVGLAVLGVAGTGAIRPLMAEIAAGPAGGDPGRLLAGARQAFLPLIAAAAAVAAVSWVCARLRFERRLRMTPREHAEEARSMQADPKVRLLQSRRAAPQTSPATGAASG